MIFLVFWHLTLNLLKALTRLVAILTLTLSFLTVKVLMCLFSTLTVLLHLATLALVHPQAFFLMMILPFFLQILILLFMTAIFLSARLIFSSNKAWGCTKARVAR